MDATAPVEVPEPKLGFKRKRFLDQGGKFTDYAPARARPPDELSLTGRPGRLGHSGRPGGELRLRSLALLALRLNICGCGIDRASRLRLTASGRRCRPKNFEQAHPRRRFSAWMLHSRPAGGCEQELVPHETGIHCVDAAFGGASRSARTPPRRRQGHELLDGRGLRGLSVQAACGRIRKRLHVPSFHSAARREWLCFRRFFRLSGDRWVFSWTDPHSSKLRARRRLAGAPAPHRLVAVALARLAIEVATAGVQPTTVRRRPGGSSAGENHAPARARIIFPPRLTYDDVIGPSDHADYTTIGSSASAGYALLGTAVVMSAAAELRFGAAAAGGAARFHFARLSRCR